METEKFKLDRFKNVGIVCCIIGIVFGFGETSYFGWNWKPASEAEFWCDFISMVFTTFGCVSLFMWYGCWLYKKNYTD